ncbi:MAG: prolyl aminopeptidase, partial [Alphaproteobacteria bacterium]|nr:prolyl aminopeptidase [Alphaproteobacteria bacterium]MDX5368703.1 prolyl aminopeptidase [Alphaproteobacteria bacterium]MDX5463445.1 prolyl aminopeptidase [Alphaproteobacteria bacterium]
MTVRRGFYPEISPNRSGMLKVSDLHTIYWEESGNPDGKPVVFVHGGPGGGTSPVNRRLFDPAAYRIVLFDQRGCGRSTPHAELRENTTWDLVADMERLREMLGIERWQVFGGSWGSTLALAYAETHPERVSELVLRGIFLLRRAEIQWFYQDGTRWLYPDLFEDYVKPIPEVERGDLVAAFYRRLTDPDPAVQLDAARAWSMWEGATLSLLPDEGRMARFGADRYAIAFARIECHYFVHGGWFRTETQLLDDAYRLKDIPGVIVHGRYDVVTPARNAWDLHRAWPEADLRIVPDAGHA